MIFDWINIFDIDLSLLQGFDSGSPVFNEFLIHNAYNWQSEAEAATYLFVDSRELANNKISRIHGYITLNAYGLLGESSAEYISCIEIRMFAIAKQLRKRRNSTIPWSDLIFKTALQNIYHIATHIIGCNAIFLNANSDGYELYKNNGFIPVQDYITSVYDKMLDISDCQPMILFINDKMIEDIFS